MLHTSASPEKLQGLTSSVSVASDGHTSPSKWDRIRSLSPQTPKRAKEIFKEENLRGSPIKAKIAGISSGEAGLGGMQCRIFKAPVSQEFTSRCATRNSSLVKKIKYEEVRTRAGRRRGQTQGLSQSTSSTSSNSMHSDLSDGQNGNSIAKESSGMSDFGRDDSARMEEEDDSMNMSVSQAQVPASNWSFVRRERGNSERQQSGNTYYLGIDCGTHSMMAVVIDQDLGKVAEVSVVYDAELPHYEVVGGVHHGLESRVTSPVLMWVEALDHLLSKLKAISKVSLEQISAVGPCGQQHGTVYWAKGANAELQSLDPSAPLHPQLQTAFVIRDSPVWMDSSTTAECRALEDKLGGAQELANITGSRACERFSGPQIASIVKEEPEAYENCEHISLVSSFLASILIGKIAPIDDCDASGTNLFNIHSREYFTPALDVVDPSGQLLRKLNDHTVSGTTLIGNISPYLRTRYGFSENCRVAAGSGDHINSLVGTRSAMDDIWFSSGSSDTIVSSLRMATPQTEGHVLCHPIVDSAYMALLCYSNGSRTRHWARDTYAGKSWKKFGEMLKRTPPGNDGYMGIFYKTEEILPQGKEKGFYRFYRGELIRTFPPHPTGGSYDVRALIESQFLAKRLHLQRLGQEQSPNMRVTVSGSLVSNQEVIQVLSDIFGAPVYKNPQGASNVACYGAAIRAYHAGEVKRDTLEYSWRWNSSELLFANIVKETDLEMMCAPDMQNHNMYSIMLLEYEAMEAKIPYKSGHGSMQVGQSIFAGQAKALKCGDCTIA